MGERVPADATGQATRGRAGSRLAASVTGGAAVAVVGLSQLLAVGALSVTALGPDALAFGVVASAVSAIVGGLCVAAVSRAPGEVSGPRTSVCIIFAALCADLVARAGPQVNIGEIWAALSLTVVLMGFIQILAAWVRVGEAVKFLPYPVNAGFVTGIGLLVIWSQIGPLLGIEGRLSNYDWPDLREEFKPAALLVGIVTVSTVWLLPKVTRRVQPLLVALAVGTACYHLLALVYEPKQLGPTLGTIELAGMARMNISSSWQGITPSWLLATVPQVLPYAAFLAMQGIMNAALTSVAVAEVAGVRPNVNRGLLAQGVGNVLCGVVAALPVAPSPSQSMLAAKMLDVNRLVPAASCMILLLAFLLLDPVLTLIPIAALAGLLLTSGVGLIDGWTRDLVKRVVRREDRRVEIKWNLGIVVAVAATFFFGSVPLALLVGAILATILLAFNLYAATTFDTQHSRGLCSRRIWPATQAQWLAEARSCIRLFRPSGALFFGTAEQLAVRLRELDSHIKYCIIDVSRLTTLDASACHIIASNANKLAAAGVTTVVAGLDASNVQDRALVDLGLTRPDRKQWFADLDHALEWIESELLKTRWPDTAADAPVPFVESPLARDLSGEELAALRSRLEMIEVAPGTVFLKRGDPGSALYVVDAGLVEIRMGGEHSGQERLAVFGPGSVFGEVALFTAGRRTADAVCIKPTRLYALSRDALDRLAQDSSVLHAKLLANLNVHLACRLIATTDVVEAR